MSAKSLKVHGNTLRVETVVRIEHRQLVDITEKVFGSDYVEFSEWTYDCEDGDIFEYDIDGSVPEWEWDREDLANWLQDPNKGSTPKAEVVLNELARREIIPKGKYLVKI